MLTIASICDEVRCGHRSKTSSEPDSETPKLENTVLSGEYKISSIPNIIQRALFCKLNAVRPQGR